MRAKNIEYIAQMESLTRAHIRFCRIVSTENQELRTREYSHSPPNRTKARTPCTKQGTVASKGTPIAFILWIP